MVVRLPNLAQDGTLIMIPKRTSVPLDQIPAALEKTGFILEHMVDDVFKKNGWSTIGGRYYADDVDGRARELDLVAYRAEKLQDIEVVAAVLVSCKKDEALTWAFLTKERPRSDPNFDWNPVHVWTDVEPLSTYIKTESWKGEHTEALGKKYRDMFSPRSAIFAFQQLGLTPPQGGKKAATKDASNGTDALAEVGRVTPRNDDQIFSSIVSVMKALDYEVDLLGTRVPNRKRLYHFTLLSVVDAPLVEVAYEGRSTSVNEIDAITHLARYMVKRRELSALIHFVSASSLSAYVECMTIAATKSAEFFSDLVAKSYQAIEGNPKVRRIIASRIKGRLIWRINATIEGQTGERGEIAELSLDYRKGRLELEVDTFDEDLLKILNEDQGLRDQVRKILKDQARYEGEFVFTENLPF